MIAILCYNDSGYVRTSVISFQSAAHRIVALDFAATGGGPTSVHCRELNGNGKMDLVASCHGAADALRVYIAN